MTPNERRENARRAASIRWSRIPPEDRADQLVDARRGFLKAFARQADPRHELSADERHVRALQLRRQYMASLRRRRS
jgi:hypothetical protein